ncbi:CDGSH iron-sulfur domain-containing protein 3, mitochondrial, partial [Asbolus verrucosus]
VSFRSQSNKIPTNTLQNTISAHKQPENGVVYDKKPFRISLAAGLWHLKLMKTKNIGFAIVNKLTIDHFVMELINFP